MLGPDEFSQLTCLLLHQDLRLTIGVWEGQGVGTRYGSTTRLPNVLGRRPFPRDLPEPRILIASKS